jgi:diamine N-acetyltransferase
MKSYLRNDKVCLRAMEPEDIELLYKWENDEEIWEVSNTVVPYSKFILALYIKNSDKDIYENKQLRLMIDSSEGTTIGTIELFDFDPYHSRAGIGIMIHNKNYRTDGNATSALDLIVDYCFEKLNLHQIYANIGKDNSASIKLFSNAGFEVVGTKKEWIKRGDQWKDELLFQLIRK